MNEVFININQTGLEEYFKKDYVSIDELVAKMQDLQDKIYRLEEEIEELEEVDGTDDPDAYDKWRESQWT